MDLTMTDDNIDNNGSGNMDDSDDEVPEDTNGADMQNGAADENGS
jgi:hypothetical protein